MGEVMRFNCGPSIAERMARKENWHKWFAWHPVRVGKGDCRWLEYVRRKGIFIQIGWNFKYKSLKETE
jgi:hypothetical protein